MVKSVRARSVVATPKYGRNAASFGNPCKQSDKRYVQLLEWKQTEQWHLRA